MFAFVFEFDLVLVNDPPLELELEGAGIIPPVKVVCRVSWLVGTNGLPANAAAEARSICWSSDSSKSAKKSSSSSVISSISMGADLARPGALEEDATGCGRGTNEGLEAGLGCEGRGCEGGSNSVMGSSPPPRVIAGCRVVVVVFRFAGLNLLLEEVAVVEEVLADAGEVVVAGDVEEEAGDDDDVAISRSMRASRAARSTLVLFFTIGAGAGFAVAEASMASRARRVTESSSSKPKSSLKLMRTLRDKFGVRGLLT